VTPLRFLVDMGISMKTVSWLRDAGHDVVHLLEQELQRLPDSEILEKARQEGRVVLTMDLDFGYLLAVSGWVLPSVVIFRLSDERPERIVARLKAVLPEFSDVLVRGAVLSVEDETIRVRRLPIR